jgi:hypothetical protein
MEDFKTSARAVAAYKWPNVIYMAGDQAGISNEESMVNCQAFKGLPGEYRALTSSSSSPSIRREQPPPTI